MNQPVRICIIIAAIITSVSIAVSQQRALAQGGRGAARGGQAAAAANNADWPTFGGDNTRTNANMAPTRITADNIKSMVRKQVTISAPIDAGLIYLRGVQVNGASHDVFFGTTNLGRTVAIDANEGKVLWEFAPSGFDEAAAMSTQRGGDNNPFGQFARFICGGSGCLPLTGRDRINFLGQRRCTVVCHCGRSIIGNPFGSAWPLAFQT